MTEQLKQRVEHRELPKEAAWGTRTLNAIKAKWKDMQIRSQMDDLNRSAYDVSDKIAVAQFTKESYAKRVQELELESQLAEIALESQRQDTLYGSGWTRIFGTPERKFKQAQKKYSYAQEARNVELRHLKAKLSGAENEIEQLSDQEAVLENRRRGMAEAYLKELNKQASPLDARWNELVERSRELETEVARFTQLQNEAEQNIERIKKAFGVKILTDSQKDALKAELAQSQKLLFASKSKIKNASIGIKAAAEKKEQLSKARDPFMRFRNFAKAATETESARAQQSPKKKQGVEDVDFPPKLDTIILDAMLDEVGTKEVRVGDYFERWNKEFPKAKIILPETFHSELIPVEELEKSLLDAVDNKDGWFAKALDDDGGHAEDDMRKRFKIMRREILMQFDV